MKPKIAVIGGGCAGLSFASTINTDKYDVFIFEKKNRLASKLLVAGKGGFNLTHSEAISKMQDAYSPTSFLNNSLQFFSNDDFINYLKKINIDTYIGSSRRVFPVKPIKPIEVIKAIAEKVTRNSVDIITNAEWTDIAKNNDVFDLTFNISGQKTVLKFEYVVFALGGASWKITGSAGDWLSEFGKLRTNTIPFEPSNCAINVNWEISLVSKIAGTPLKNISVKCGDRIVLGEVMLTDFGLEGTPIYALSKSFRDAINQNLEQYIFIDLKPTSTKKSLSDRLSEKQVGSWTDHIKKQLKLSKNQLDLIKSKTTKTEYQSPKFIIDLIKSYPIRIEGLAPIDEAISTVGGIDLSEVTEQFELKNCKNVFVLGEMLDWDAPTGGYLIQGCMSMGQYLSNHFNQSK